MQKNLDNLFLKAFPAVLVGISAIVLYCLWAYLNVWEVNYIHNEYIDYVRLVGTFCITLIFAGFIFLFIYLCTGLRSPQKSLFATAAFMVLFLNFHFYSNLVSNNYGMYLILSVISVGIVYYLSKFSIFRQLALIIPVVAISSIVGNVIIQKYILAKSIVKQDWTQSYISKPPNKLKHSPNVYFIILDSTLRVDAFKRFFDKDDKYYDDFLSYAKEKGFYIVENAYSNYPITGFSIPSTLNMDFVIWSNSKGPEKIKNRTDVKHEITDTMKGYNAVSVAFRARGYKIYHTSNGLLPASDCGGFEDVCIRKKKSYASFTQQELGLIKMTPFSFILDDRVRNAKKIPDLESGFPINIMDDTIIFYHSFQPQDIPKYIPIHETKPFFWFIHLMGMHNLAFTTDCSYRHPANAPAVNELNPACKVSPMESEIRAAAYRKQLPCMFKQLKFAIDEIVKRDPQAIVIIQGDHGSSVVNDFRKRPTEQWTEKDVHEVFSILNIIRCPEECRQMLYPDMTSVNTFRIVFSYIDGKKYELLPDVSYLAAYRNWWPSYKNDEADFVPPSLKQHPQSRTQGMR